MATGYATFLKDSKNDIPADRILNLSPSNDDDEFILQSGANKNKEQPTGFLHELVKHAAACFTTDDVQDGVPGLRQPRDVLHRKRTQEEATTLACFAFLPSGYVSTRSMKHTDLAVEYHLQLPDNESTSKTNHANAIQSFNTTTTSRARGDVGLI
eukprot:scaffold1600_cov79-Skeletonema_dohrnii-CCMP3373.AAC.5